MTRATGIAILSAGMVVFCLGAGSVAAETSGRKPNNMRKASGTVRDTAGRPLEGARVQICPRSGNSVLSNKDGKFEIAWRHDSWVEAAYLVARCAEKNLAIALRVGEETENLNVTLQPAVRLAGMVADPNGRPITGADVRVDLRASNWVSPLDRALTRTDEAGRFEVPAVPADNRYRIAASATGYGRSETQLRENKTAAGAVDVAVLTLAAANLSVTGRVVDVDGKPMPGVRVYSGTEAQPRVSTHSDEEGHFTLDPVCAGEIRIFAEVRIDGKDVAGTVITEGGASEIPIVISEGRSVTRYIRTKTYDQIVQGGAFIAGVALDESGLPVADVPVGVCCTKRKDAEGSLSWSFSTYARQGDVTDAKGRFIIELEEQAEYCLRFSPRHHAAFIAYDVPVGTNDLKVTLPCGGTIAGRLVRMEKGRKKPIPHVEVRIEQAERWSFTHLGFERDRTRETDSDGRFQVEHVRTKMRPIDSMRRQEWQYIPRIWKVVHEDTAETVVFENDTKVMNLELVVRPDPADAARLIGVPLPPFDGIDLDLAPDQTEGKSLLICFFDMNQRPSRHCVRTLSERASQLAGSGVLVVAIHAAEADSLEAWAKKSKIALPVGTVAGDVEEMKYTWAVRSLPWLILTDREHIVRAAGFAVGELDKIMEQAGIGH